MVLAFLGAIDPIMTQSDPNEAQMVSLLYCVLVCFHEQACILISRTLKTLLVKRETYCIVSFVVIY